MAGQIALRSSLSSRLAFVAVAMTAAAFLFAPTSAHATQAGPVAAYSFDEGEGETVTDLTGDEHTATIEGAHWTAHGRYGGAMEFDAAEGDELTIPASEDFHLEEFTLEAWVRPDEALELAPVVADTTTGPGAGPGWALFAGGYLDEAGHPEAMSTEGDSIAATASREEPLPDRAWSHLAATYDGAALRLYVDGELVDTTATTPGLVLGEGEVQIGGDEPWDEGGFLDGRIDELRIYERALSAGEVAADMEAPIQTPKQGPVAAFSFDEGEGTTSADLSGAGHTATIEGAEWSNGRYGHSLHFDGSEDCVSVAESEDLRLDEEFTLEAWVRPDPGSPGDEPIITQEDEGYGEGEEPYAYMLLAGNAETPEGWVRIEGEHEYAGIYGDEALPGGAWSHIALTDDGAHLRLYQDGRLVRTAAAPVMTEAHGNLTIGCDRAFGAYFTGRIDELRIYNRAITGAEVAADREAPLQTPKAGPVAAYSFDEGEGETVTDLTGGGHEATIEGAQWSKGRYGGGLQFGGEGDCATVTDVEGLGPGEEFTLEAWVRYEGSGESSRAFLTMEDPGAPLLHPRFSYMLLAGDGESPEARLRDGEELLPERIHGNDPIPKDAWTQVTLTDDGAHLRLYMDGELVDTGAAPELTLAEGPLRLGCGGGHHFDGRIDELRIYERALSAGEVAADMEAPIQTPRQGPVAAWSFDEGEGETSADLSGAGHTATIEGAEWSNGRYGHALHFDGSEDCVSVAESEDLRLDEEFTLEAWVRPDGGSTDEGPLITQEDEAYGEGEEPYAYSLLAGLDEQSPEGFVRIGGEHEYEGIYGDGPLARGAWSHIALTDDGAHLRLYQDGALVRSAPAPVLTIAHGPLTIGCDEIFAAHFKGRIDEVRIYNRAITGAEVAADREGPLQTPKAGPVAAYSFDEGEGETVEDLTGDGHTATIEGAQWVSHGKFGGALAFDGTSSCVSIADATDLRLGEEFTLESWVRPESETVDGPILFKEGSGFPNYVLEIGHATSGRPEGSIGVAASPHRTAATGPESVDASTWTHLASVFDGSKDRLYVNGALVATETVAAAESDREGALKIGCAGQYSEFFHGRIDEVRVYNRALNGSEVAASPGPLPTVQTKESEPDSTEAVLVGSVDPRGYATSFQFEYGLTTAYGNRIPESTDELERWLIGDESEEVDQAIDGLDPETTYHWRLIATNALGTVVGQDQTFTTAGPEFSLRSSGSFGGNIGINWSGQNTSLTEEQYVNQSSAKMFRVVISPGCTKNKPEMKSRQEKNDALFLYMAQHEITILPNVSGIPCRSDNKLPKIANGSPALQRWEEGLRALTNRYGPGGKFWEEHSNTLHPYEPTYWEIWNEENVEKNASDDNKIIPERYGELLGASHDALQESNSQVKVLFGGLLTVGKTVLQRNDKKPERVMTIREFIKKAGHSSDYDAVSLHPYAFIGSVKDVTKKVKGNIKSVRAAIDKFGGGSGKEIWVTEIGWPVQGPESDPGDEVHVRVSAAVQTERLESSIDMTENYAGKFNIANIFWYNIKDVGGSRWDLHCGLFERNGTKRSAFAAFKSRAE